MNNASDSEYTCFLYEVNIALLLGGQVELDFHPDVTKRLTNLSQSTDDLKYELVQWAAYYEHRMQRGSKDVFHFEAFLAKFMTLYKKFLRYLYM
jgi:hypothetical protein